MKDLANKQAEMRKRWNDLRQKQPHLFGNTQSQVDPMLIAVRQLIVVLSDYVTAVTETKDLQQP